MSRGPVPMHSQQPPGVVQNRSTLQCSKQNTEQCGYDHAPVTRGRMRAQFPLPHGPLNGSSTLFATIYDLFQGPVTGAKEGGGPGKGLQRPPPPPAQANFPPPECKSLHGTPFRGIPRNGRVLVVCSNTLHGVRAVHILPQNPHLSLGKSTFVSYGVVSETKGSKASG